MYLIKNKLNIKSKKASITLYVLIVVLFFSIVLTTAYISGNNKIQSQEDQIRIIKENYGKNTSLESMEQIYNDIIEEIE